MMMIMIITIIIIIIIIIIPTGQLKKLRPAINLCKVKSQVTWQGKDLGRPMVLVCRAVLGKSERLLFLVKILVHLTAWEPLVLAIVGTASLPLLEEDRI